jgi:hypothetical protein
MRKANHEYDSSVLPPYDYDNSIVGENTDKCKVY